MDLVMNVSAQCIGNVCTHNKPSRHCRTVHALKQRVLELP